MGDGMVIATFVGEVKLMHPGVKARRVENIFTPLLFVRHVHQIDHFNAHGKPSFVLLYL